MIKRPFTITSVLPLLVLVGGIAAAALFVMIPHTARKGAVVDDQGMLVQVQPVQQGDYIAKVEAMGRVLPAKQVQLRARISGEVMHVAKEYIPGGLFKQGASMLQIDPEDYRLAFQTQQALYQQAQADFQLEMGRQAIARDELEILAKMVGKKPENTELALRRPQLDQARAAMQIAKSNLDQARLNLERATVKAPFNALVTERFVTAGDTVSPQDSLATLISTDEYWVELALPVQQLPWLVVPAQGVTPDKASKAHVHVQESAETREGYLLRVVGTLDSESRLANVLISVPDPLLQKAAGSEKAPLIVGDYVSVVLEGKPLKDVFRLPNQWVRDGSKLWLLVDGKLEIREVDIVYEDREFAYIAQGLTADEMVVTSEIISPIPGLKLRVDAPEAGVDAKAVEE